MAAVVGFLLVGVVVVYGLGDAVFVVVVHLESI